MSSASGGRSPLTKGFELLSDYKSTWTFLLLQQFILNTPTSWTSRVKTLSKQMLC